MAEGFRPQVLVRHSLWAVVLAGVVLLSNLAATVNGRSDAFLNRTDGSARRLASAQRSGSSQIAIDPLLAGEWYLAATRAFEFWPVPAPPLTPVRVAVLDSGIDGAQPDFRGRVAAARSFAGGSPLVDEIGHGTMVAGEILAAAGERPDGQQTVAPVDLVIGKIVGPDGTIDVGAEAAAIRWAADHGARVINLSLGGRRDPANPVQDEYSPIEDAAVQYAYRKGALVVAATGNCEDVCPYDFADYPAALAHVLAISAYAEDGSTPAFSNRDSRRNDLAAPGVGIVSTYPLALSIPGCAQPGYSVCASDPDYRPGDGTSFAAPLASAAAALLLCLQPTLTPNQVMSIVEHTADHAAGRGHNAENGYGRLDIASAIQALSSPLPQPNSRAGLVASTGVFRFGGAQNAVRATLDYYDDPRDAYAIYLRRGELVSATLTGPIAGGIDLALLTPTARDVRTPSQRQPAASVIVRAGRPAKCSLGYRARTSGWYRLTVRAARPVSGAYRLLVRRS